MQNLIYKLLALAILWWLLPLVERAPLFVLGRRVFGGDPTMAELLREQGYVTGAFGKWGLGGPGSEGEPLKQGFDRFYGFLGGETNQWYPDLVEDMLRLTERLLEARRVATVLVTHTVHETKRLATRRMEFSGRPAVLKDVS